MAFTRVASPLFLVFLATLGSGVGAEDDGPSVLRSMLAAFMKQGTCGTVLPTAIMASDKDGLVKKHNELRSKVAKGDAGPTIPKATNMKKLMWDDSLAKKAQDSADKCDLVTKESGAALDAGALTGVHQNKDNGTLAENAAKVLPFSEGILDRWFNGKSKLTAALVDSYAAQTDPDAERFAQLAFAETELVGCGFKHFKATAAAPAPTAILVCNYHPGLKTGVPVYKKGEPCSSCGDGYKCNEMKLCAKDSGDSSSTGESKAEEGGFSFLAIVGILGALVAVGGVIAGVVHMKKMHGGAAPAGDAPVAPPGGPEEGGSHEAAAGDAAGADGQKGEAGAEGEKAGEAQDAPAASQDALTKK